MLLFLDLIDYVSRAHEIEIRPSAVIRPSVRVAIIQQKFQKATPSKTRGRKF